MDPSGEVVCAGSMDPFEIYIWSLQTGRLLDVLSGHEGPVSGLAFSPNQVCDLGLVLAIVLLAKNFPSCVGEFMCTVCVRLSICMQYVHTFFESIFW